MDSFLSTYPHIYMTHSIVLRFGRVSLVSLTANRGPLYRFNDNASYTTTTHALVALQ
jgi:hypothetical protein